MRYSIVDTAIGAFGFAWTAAGLRRALLPAADRATLEAKLARFAEAAREGEADRSLVERVEAYGSGAAVSFVDMALDLGGLSDFNRAVLADIMRLGWGETTTYGAIAERLGGLHLARAVGRALGANPIPLIIPCHRVLAAGGRPGGFSAPGGVESKLRMLALEGVALGRPPAEQMAFGF